MRAPRRARKKLTRSDIERVAEKLTVGKSDPRMLPLLADLEAVARKTRKRPVRPEKAIQRAVLDFLANVPGVVAWKSGAGAFRLSYKGKERFVRMGKRGVSDIVGFRRHWFETTRGGNAVIHPCAVFLAIEVKRPGQYPDEHQRAFLDAVERAGGIAVVAYSVADVARALRVDVTREGAPSRR